MNELREEIELPALSNYSLENMRNASDEMQREAFQGFFLLAKREREAQLKSSLAANREQKAEIERLAADVGNIEGILSAYDYKGDSREKLLWLESDMLTAQRKQEMLERQLASLRASVGEKPEDAWKRGNEQMRYEVIEHLNHAGRPMLGQAIAEWIIAPYHEPVAPTLPGEEK